MKTIENLPIIQSYGGGLQSVATVVLACERVLPMPERFVIADTGREASSTWSYAERYVAPLLSEWGRSMEIAPRELATVDLYGKNGDLLMPVFTRQNNGELGKMPTLCSSEWKQRVVRRYLRSLGYGPNNPAQLWIGISVDEIWRAKPSGLKWLTHRWPLLFDVTHSRAECRQIVLDAGLPVPPKSSCWMCPHRRNPQWRELRDNAPEDWARAVELDAELRRHDRDVYVHYSGKPLAEALIDEPEPDTSQGALFGDLDGCDSGYCMT